MTITTSMPEEVVDVRCPAGQRRADGTCHPGPLLFRLRRDGVKPAYVHPDNLIELACDDCARKLRKAGRPVQRVLHRYDFVGELVSTLIEEAGK